MRTPAGVQEVPYEAVDPGDVLPGRATVSSGAFRREGVEMRGQTPRRELFPEIPKELQMPFWYS